MSKFQPTPPTPFFLSTPKFHGPMAPTRPTRPKSPRNPRNLAHSCFALVLFQALRFLCPVKGLRIRLRPADKF